MFDYEAAITTLIETALDAPKGHGLMVFQQLDRPAAAATFEKIIDAWLATPEFAQKLDAAGVLAPDARRTAAWESLDNWFQLAAIAREDLFPKTYTFISDARPTTDIVGDRDARIYTGVLREILGSGLIKLFYAPHISRDINDLPSPEKLPLLYIWEKPDQEAPMFTVNGASIDHILETRLTRTHRHFRGVREWMVLRSRPMANT
jgi:hypothetical protein